MKLKELRENLNLTQKEVSESAHIDAATLRRIEAGKVIPKFETLESLSPVLKHDLILLLLEYRFDDFSVFYDIKNRMESKFDSSDLDNLNNELKELRNLLSLTENKYYKNLIVQLILFSEAIILYNNNDNNKALNKLIKSIKITTPKFNLSNYNSFAYSSMEIRILMNIALVLYKLNDETKYLEILEFCIKEVNTDDEVYPKVCYNLAGAYTRNKEYEKALHFYNMGIIACQDNRNLGGLSLLYYAKGIAEYKLARGEYIESLKTSLYLCKAFGQTKLENIIKKNCREVFGIDL